MTFAHDEAKAEFWHAAECYAEMTASLRASGYRSYAEAQADATSRDPARIARWARFHWRWSTLMWARVGIDPRSLGSTGGRPLAGQALRRPEAEGYGARSPTDRRALRRRATDPAPLPPAVLASCRAALALALAPLATAGRPRTAHGRRRPIGILVGEGAG